MATIKIYDGASEFRIEITGRFQAESVDEVGRMWRRAMQESTPRRCIIDISRISEYDQAGCKLLRDMYHHRTQISAATPLSLLFLKEILTPRRRGPALVRERPAPKQAGASVTKLRPAAAGE